MTPLQIQQFNFQMTRKLFPILSLSKSVIKSGFRQRKKYLAKRLFLKTHFHWMFANSKWANETRELRWFVSRNPRVEMIRHRIIQWQFNLWGGLWKKFPIATCFCFPFESKMPSFTQIPKDLSSLDGSSVVGFLGGLEKGNRIHLKVKNAIPLCQCC